MKVLFIGLRYFGYENKIKEEMEKHNCSVDLIYDKPEKYKDVKNAKTEDVDFQIKQLDACSDGYDLIFVLVGRRLSEKFFISLKSRYPNTKTVLYLWDDVKRVENYEDIKQFYDEVYSFDDVDCKNYGFKHLPLFYTNDYFSRKCKKNYDLYSAFSAHTDRFEVAEKIVKDNPEKKIRIVMASTFYKKSRLYMFLYRIYKNIVLPKQIYFSTKTINADENCQLLNSSRYVLDIQVPGQNGLTMRTLECLGCGVKLVTTNENIKKYDFYDPRNIQVINRKNPKLIFDDTPYNDLSEEVYKKYSIENWVNSILTGKVENYLL